MRKYAPSSTSFGRAPLSTRRSGHASSSPMSSRRRSPVARSASKLIRSRPRFSDAKRRFDAQTDPVVRIEAGRIRRALERYYLTAGQNDAIVITIPKGGYVPVFKWQVTASVSASAGASVNEEPAAAPAPAATRPAWFGPAAAALLLLAAAVGWFVRPLGARRVSRPRPIFRRLVQPFEDLSGTENSALIARGLTEEIIGQIALFKEIAVITDGARNADGVARAANARYALQGGVRLEGDRLRLTARLQNRSDGSVVWARSFDENLQVDDLLRLEANIARAVATELAQPYGIIFQSDATTVLKSPPADWKAYACTLAYYGYRADLDPQTHASVQTCLKEAVERYPNYATAWALLSLTYLDELRFRYRLNPPSTPPLELAAQAARRSVELDPQNVRGLEAEMLAFYFRGDVATALSRGARALAINPNDTELLGEYGFRLALSGQWEEGCGYAAECRRTNPGPLGYFEVALAVCAYMRRDYAAAEEWVTSADLRVESHLSYRRDRHSWAARQGGRGREGAAMDESQRSGVSQQHPA